MPKAPFHTTRLGMAIFGIGGAGLGAAMDLGLIFDRPLAEPLLSGLVSALDWGDYRPDQYWFYVVLIALFSALWLSLCVHALVVQHARDRALEGYLRSRERIEVSRRATMTAEMDPPG